MLGFRSGRGLKSVRRHIAKGSDGIRTSLMGVKAARIAIERAGLSPPGH